MPEQTKQFPQLKQGKVKVLEQGVFSQCYSKQTEMYLKEVFCFFFPQETTI